MEMADQAAVELTYAEAARRCFSAKELLKKTADELKTAVDDLDKPNMGEATKAFHTALQNLKTAASDSNINKKLITDAKELYDSAKKLVSDKNLDIQAVEKLKNDAKELRKTVEAVDNVPEEIDLEKLCNFLHVGEAWRETLLDIFKEANIRDIFGNLANKQNVCPPVYNLFSWTRVPGCGPDDVKVVIVGQDPVPKGTGIAFVLYTESNDSINNLLRLVNPREFRPMWSPFMWCMQGVLMINNIPTIGAKWENHQHVGWKAFTREVVRRQVERNSGVVFILFGSQARDNLKTMLRTAGAIENPTPADYGDANERRNPTVFMVYGHPSSNNQKVWNRDTRWDEEKKQSGNNPLKKANEHLRRIRKRLINWDAMCTAICPSLEVAQSWQQAADDAVDRDGAEADCGIAEAVGELRI